MNDPKKTEENLHEVAAHMQRGEPKTEKAAGAEQKNKPEKSHSLAKFGSTGLALAFLFGKLKWLLVAGKFLKFSSVISMFVSVWAYSMFFGWPFAVGFVALIVVHETGHLLVMKMFGIPAGAPVYIPFMGAVIAMKGRPRNAYVEAMVAFGGPVLGSVGALACLLIAMSIGSDFWRSLAYVGFMINLFNLLPISPLDGGRIVGAFNRWLWVLGFVIAIPLIILTHSPMIILIMIVGAFSLIGRRKEPAGYLDIPKSVKRKIGVSYFGLVAILALLMSISRVVLQ